jgi:hypothetical protein
MTKTIEERYLDRMRLILNDLNNRSWSRIDLMRRFLRKADAACSFHRTFYFLTKTEHVKKVSTARRAPNVITEKGRKLLEAIKP